MSNTNPPDGKSAKAGLTRGMTSRKRRPKSPEDKQLLKDISYRLGVLRRHLGHTPQSFAAALGMTVRAYIAYERGERTGRGWLGVMFGLFDLTNVSADWLFTGLPSAADDSTRRNDQRPLFSGGRPMPPAVRLAGRA